MAVAGLDFHAVLASLTAAAAEQFDVAAGHAESRCGLTGPVKLTNSTIALESRGNSLAVVWSHWIALFAAYL